MLKMLKIFQETWCQNQEKSEKSYKTYISLASDEVIEK